MLKSRNFLSLASRSSLVFGGVVDIVPVCIKLPIAFISAVIFLFAGAAGGIAAGGIAAGGIAAGGVTPSGSCVRATEATSAAPGTGGLGGNNRLNMD